MPSKAKAIIFFRGYLLSPAKRSPRSYSTVSDLNPTSGTMPRRNRLTSEKDINASTALRLISR